MAALGLAGCGLETPQVQPGIEGEAIDWSAEPCSDFYRFACGNWERWHAIQPDGAAASRFESVQRALTRLQVSLVEEDAKGTPHDDDPEAGKIGDYYRTCRGSLEGVAVTGPALEAMLADVATIATPGQLAAVEGRLRVADAPPFFELSVRPDPDAPTQPELLVAPGGMGMPWAYFVDADKANFRDAYRAHVDALIDVVGREVSLPPQLDGALVLRVEGALAKAAPSDEQWRDPRATHHATAFKDFRSALPAFDWDAFALAAGIPTLAFVDVVWPPYLTALNTVLGTTPLSDLRAYLAWRVLEADAAALGWPVQQVEFNFHTRLFEGRTSDVPAWWQCFLNTTNDLGFALSRPFVARVFDGDRRAEALRMIASLRARMGELLASEPWLDDATRAEALAKLTQVTPKIGFPDVWPSYNDYTTSPTDYLANVVGRRTKAWRNAMQHLVEPVDRGRWYVAPIVTNAYYDPTGNDITFPAAILQPPFFDLGRSPAVNYGSIGSVMGHELTHGFDDEGSQYDGLGALRDWWSPVVAQQFGARAACLVDQYDGVHPLPGTMVNGQLTLGENIADLGGLKLAYAAFHADDGGRGEGAPGPFSPDQQFFLAYAQGWCEEVRPAYLRTLLQNDPHPPWSARVNGVVANVPEFAAAFRCGAGAPLAPANRCQIW